MRVGADRGAVPATLGPAIGFDPHGCGLVREQAERRTQKPPFLKKSDKCQGHLARYPLQNPPVFDNVKNDHFCKNQVRRKNERFCKNAYPQPWKTREEERGRKLRRRRRPKRPRKENQVDRRKTNTRGLPPGEEPKEETRSAKQARAEAAREPGRASRTARAARGERSHCGQ